MIAAPEIPASRTALRLPRGRAAASTEHVLDPDTLGDHLDRMFRAAWALCGSRHEAEDLVQDTFARVLARPRFVRNGDDVPYLLRVLRNTFISRHRARSRRPQKADLEVESLNRPDTQHGHDPLAVVQTHEVYEAIAALPPDFRDALVAIDVAGLSYREAARALGVREGTVTSRLHRARSRVADAFSE
jgi:RNA polymerase sigma-70 factor (ECF subfamily)